MRYSWWSKEIPQKPLCKGNLEHVWQFKSSEASIVSRLSSNTSPNITLQVIDILTQRIPVWYIYIFTYIWLIYMVNVRKYTSFPPAFPNSYPNFCFHSPLPLRVWKVSHIQGFPIKCSSDEPWHEMSGTALTPRSLITSLFPRGELWRAAMRFSFLFRFFCVGILRIQWTMLSILEVLLLKKSENSRSTWRNGGVVKLVFTFVWWLLARLAGRVLNM